MPSPDGAATTRDLSTREPSAWRAAGPQTASAAARSQPPAKTERRQHLPLLLVEQLPGPVDDGAQGLLAGQDGAAARGEQPEAVVQAVGDLPGGQHPQPGGGQFDGQRQAVEAAADLGAGRRVSSSASGGSRGGRRRPGREQPERRGLGQRLHRAQQLPGTPRVRGWWRGRSGSGSGRAVPRRGGRRRRRRARSCPGRSACGPAAVLDEALDGGGLPVGDGDGPHLLGAGAVQHGLAGAQRGQHGLRYGAGVVDGGEFGEPGAVPRRLSGALGGLLRQPGLAGAAGPSSVTSRAAARIARSASRSASRPTKEVSRARRLPRGRDTATPSGPPEATDAPRSGYAAGRADASRSG